jgi:NAD-dependent DNA ligase
MFVIYQPIYKSLAVPGFTAYQICVTGFEGMEREHIGKLLRLMGAKVTDGFSKKNTHLVYKTPSGVKYEKAAQWNVQTKDLNWLMSHVTDATILPPESKPARQATPELAEPSVLSRHPSLLEMTMGQDRSIFDPSAVSMAKESEELLSCVASPESKRRQSAGLLNIAHISLNNFYLSASAFSSLGTPLDKVVSRNLSKAVENMADTTSTLTSLLQGVKIVISSKLSHRRQEIQALAQSLGAEFVGDVFHDQCTHYLHYSTRVNETFKDFRLAKRKGKFILSPQWLYQVRCLFQVCCRV